MKKRHKKGIITAAVFVAILAAFVAWQWSIYARVSDQPRIGFDNFMAIRCVLLWKCGIGNPDDHRIVNIGFEDNGFVRVMSGRPRGEGTRAGTIFHLRKQGLKWEVVAEYEWES